jgi:hypothetical protein
MRQRWVLATLFVAMSFPGNLRADPDPEHWRSVWAPRALERYLTLKGGGLVLDGLEGSYFGIEGGATANEIFDLGFSIDWFRHRDRTTTRVLDTGDGFQPPIRAEITTFENGADFVPFGVTLRLQLPLRGARVRPYVAGTLGYEILYLQFSNSEAGSPPYGLKLGRSETLYGSMWQAAAGVAVDLGQDVELLGEVGMHAGSPSREARLDGVPVDLRVDLDGAYLRAGVRIRI